MKNRDRFITIAFLVFILVIPSVSVVRSFIPKSDTSLLTEAEKAVLEQNGTMQTDTNEETDTQDEAVVEEVNEPLFTRLQGTINTFIEGLFGRTKLIAFNTKLTSLLTGGTYIESTQTLLGKNNMFFYKTEIYGQPIWDYMGINHFTDDELNMMVSTLTSTKAYLNGRGIEFYVMCMPNKEIVYEENMPDTISRVDTVSRGEQLESYINENTDVVFVYPKDELIAAKNESDLPLWYNTDTHCNQRGSFVALQALFEKVYGTSRTLDSVSFRTDATNYAGDLVTIAGIADDYGIDTVYVFETESADSSQYHDQTLLFVGDSFGGFLSAVSKGYYNEVYWINPEDFKTSMYDEYNPDVIIYERVERYCEMFMLPIFTAE